MISRRGFFAVLAGVLAAPKALFGKKEVLTVAKINEVAEQAKAVAVKPFDPPIKAAAGIYVHPKDLEFIPRELSSGLHQPGGVRVYVSEYIPRGTAVRMK